MVCVNILRLRYKSNNEANILFLLLLGGETKYLLMGEGDGMEGEGKGKEKSGGCNLV